jgi:hypothetical protein
VVPPETLSELEAQGSAGAAAAQLAQSSATTGLDSETTGRDSSDKANDGNASADSVAASDAGVEVVRGQETDESSTPFGAIFNTITGTHQAEGGLGIALPLLVIAVVAWGVALVVRSRQQER